MNAVREKIESRLQKIAYLPTMPQVLFKIEEALRDEMSAADRIGAIVSQDPALTASVLRVANSVVYRGRLSKRIASVPQAVARLGFTEVKRICMSSALIRAFEGFGAGINHIEFWRHCLTVGLATRIFRRSSREPNLLTEKEVDDAFVAGLLHDVGMLVMDQFFPEQFAKVREHADASGVPLAAAENQVLGIHHGEIGGTLLASWHLPDTVVDAITWHHDPDRAAAAHRTVAQMVHLADFICVNQSIGDTLEGFYDDFSPGAWHDLGLSVDQVPQMLEDLKDEAERSDVLGGTF
jgi:HD-like signal output (HDOD) protein